MILFLQMSAFLVDDSGLTPVVLLNIAVHGSLIRIKLALSFVISGLDQFQFCFQIRYIHIPILQTLNTDFRLPDLLFHGLYSFFKIYLRFCTKGFFRDDEIKIRYGIWILCELSICPHHIQQRQSSSTALMGQIQRDDVALKDGKGMLAAGCSLRTDEPDGFLHGYGVA